MDTVYYNGVEPSSLPKLSQIPSLKIRPTTFFNRRKVCKYPSFKAPKQKICFVRYAFFC